MIYPFNAGEVFKIALNIEENGYDFYLKASEMPFPEEVKNLFIILGKEELVHKKIFNNLMNSLPDSTINQTVWDPDNELDQYLKMMADNHVFLQDPEIFAQKKIQMDSPEQAIKMAMDFEKDTIVFFTELMTASEGNKNQDAIKRLVIEEQKHLKSLTMLLKKFKKN